MGGENTSKAKFCVSCGFSLGVDEGMKINEQQIKIESPINKALIFRFNGLEIDLELKQKYGNNRITAIKELSSKLLNLGIAKSNR